MVTIVLSAVALVLYWISFKSTREVVPRGEGQLNLSATLKAVGQNRPLLVLCLGALFLLGGSFTMNAVMLYYARDVTGNATYFTWLFLCQTAGTISIASLVPAITEKFGKRIGYVALALVAVVGFVLIALTPTGSLPMALLAFLVYGVGFGGTNALMFSMQADTVDYGEWKTGGRAEGGSYAVLSFVRKTGQGLGGFLGGALVGAFGYVTAAHAQSSEAIQGIKIAAGWAPAALCVLAALVISFYPLTDDEYRTIVRELHARRARHALGTTTAAGGAVSLAGDGGLVAARPVVTINEQYGAGAACVAPRVADRLGVPYAGTRFSSEELEQAEAAEPAAASAAASRSSVAAFGLGGVEGFLRSFSRTATDVDASVSADAQSNTRVVEQNVAEVMDMVKDSGGVVVGRDATVILAQMKGALHVRLEAPAPTRIIRAAEADGLGTDVAAQRQEREDRMRTLMSQRLMQWDPADARNYDLVIDIGEVSLHDAVDMIVTASEAKRAT
jgi:glucuronide carrier protein